MSTGNKQTIIKIGNFELSRDSKAFADKQIANKPKVIGVSGNGGNSWQSFDNGEYLKRLQGQSGRAIYDEMRRSDPQIKTILQAITLPIRQANYFVDPASDDSKDREIAEETQLDFLSNMSLTWDDTIRHILLMLPFGFSILEKVWEYKDNRIRPRKLDPRLPQSIVRWKWNKKDRRLIGPIQHDEDINEILLPIEKIVVFTLDREGDNWEGISLLRSLYKAWYIKSTLEKINAIKHDRHGVGTPKTHLPPGISEGDEKWNQAIEMMESLQAQEQAYVLEPDGWIVDILGGNQKAGTDALPSIKYYDEAMARAALTMFVMLGQTESGSRALGDSFTDIFLLSLQALAEYICEVINRFVIKEYVDYNWSVKEYPILKVRRIQQLDPATLQLLAQANLITYDIDLENSIRDELNLPEKQVEEEDMDNDEKGQDSKSKEKETDEEEEKQDNEEEQHETHSSLSDSSYATDRELTPQERLCDIYDIEQRLNAETIELTEKILDIKEAQQSRIIDELVGGKKIQNITAPSKKDMYDLLIKAYKKEFRESKKQALEEMRRQVPKRNLQEDIDPSDLFRIVEEELAVKVEGASNKLKTLLATEALDLKKKGLTGNELKDALITKAREKISDVTWKDLSSSSVNQAMGAGRDAAMEAYSDEIEEVYRSGILDGNLCAVCRTKDQITHELGDPEYMTPDPDCFGGIKRCRCINIAIMKEENESNVS